MMIGLFKAHIYPLRDQGASIPWYLGYAGLLPNLGGGAQVFYLIPLNFLVIAWNRVIWRLQFGPLYVHRIEDEYRRGRQEAVECTRFCYTAHITTCPHYQEDGKITISDEPEKVGRFDRSGVISDV